MFTNTPRTIKYSFQGSAYSINGFQCIPSCIFDFNIDNVTITEYNGFIRLVNYVIIRECRLWNITPQQIAIQIK